MIDIAKGRPLSPNAFFFATGSTSAIDNNTNANIFDARDLATEIYTQIGATKFSELALTWAVQMANIYRTHPAEYAIKAADDGTMAKGFFVGEDQFGNIEAAGQVIIYRLLNNFTNEQINIPPSQGDIAPLFHNGHLEVIHEFFDGAGRSVQRKSLPNLETIRERTLMPLVIPRGRSSKGLEWRQWNRRGNSRYNPGTRQKPALVSPARFLRRELKEQKLSV
jgi:hypothetical protein